MTLKNITYKNITRYFSLILFFSLYLFTQAIAGDTKNTKRQHYISITGKAVNDNEDKFKHFGYVNSNAPKGGLLRISALGSFNSFNPFTIEGDPAAGVSYLEGSLLHASLGASGYNDIGTYYGYVAKYITKDPNNYWVEFEVNDKASFSDNSPITADDVIFSFKELLRNGRPFFKQYYHHVKSIEKIDRLRVRFNFKDNKNHEIAAILSQLPVISKKYYSKIKGGVSKSSLKVPVHSGPYTISEFKVGRYVKYKRNKNWWGEKLPVNVGRYNFDYIKFIYFMDDDVRFEAFKSGDYDFRIENKIARWKKSYNFPAFNNGKVVKREIKLLQNQPMTGLVFNLRRSKFKDIRVRKALNYAFDFDWINKKFFYNSYTRTRSYFQGSLIEAKGMPDKKELEFLSQYKYQLPSKLFEEEFNLPDNSSAIKLRRSLIKATKLLKEAGYIIKNGKLINKQTKIPLSIDVMINNKTFNNILLHYKENLERLGIALNIRVVDDAQYILKRNNFDYDVIVESYLQSLSPGNEQINFWSSESADKKGSRNFMGLKNYIIDAAINNLLSKRKYKDIIIAAKIIDRLLQWGYYMIPFWHLDHYNIAYCNDRIKMPRNNAKYNIDIYAMWSNNIKNKAMK